jgi:glycosyltransferase involved in cell wall biosynthesis
MNIIIASTIVPFLNGGGSLIVDWLELTLKKYGHNVDVFRVPFTSWYPVMPEQMLALRLLDISEHGDRLIAIRTPSYLLRHPNKVLWFIHHHRTAYDLWGTQYQELPSTPNGVAYRQLIMDADNVAFAESKKIFTNSRIVSSRLQQFNGVGSEVLYPPLFEPERYRKGSYGDYILYVSRVTLHKRQHLLVEALQATRTPVRLVLAGKSESAEYLQQIKALIERLGLQDRVTLLFDWISHEEKITLLANCLAVAYVPFDEDSYGYVSLEAHHAGKAVITTADSGGPLELITDGENGLITDPTWKAIAAAFDKLYSDRKLARRLGECGVEKIQQLGITWDKVVSKLLS